MRESTLRGSKNSKILASINPETNIDDLEH